MINIEKTTILDNIISTIRYYTNIDTINRSVIETMYNNWAVNKEHIYNLFGGRLKVITPIEFTYNDIQIQEMVDNFVVNHKNDEFILANKFLLMLSIKEIINNKLEYDFKILDTKFNKGMKISKVLTKIIPLKYVDNYVTDYSMLLQKFKVNGEVVLSIDPLDYLTMSENNSNWESCHAFGNCYQTGMFAYLQDNCTIITYIKSNKDIKINSNLSISNKVWRQIMLLNPDDTYAVQLRQYPNSNNNNSIAAANLMITLLEEKHNRKFNRVLYDMNDTINEKIMHTLCSDNRGTYAEYWYNDVTHGTFKKGFIIAPVEVNIQNDILEYTKEFKYCTVGYDVYCLNCGEYNDSSESLLCDCCNNYKGEHYID